MQPLKARVLAFLYTWTEENKIPNIRKGMVEDLEQFITTLQSETEIQKSAERMQNISDKVAVNETKELN